MPCGHSAQLVRSEGARASERAGRARVGRGCCTHFEWSAINVHAVQRAGVDGDVGIDASVEQQLDDVKHAVLTTAMDHTGLPEVLRVLGTEASGVDGAVVLKNDPCALVRIGMRVDELDCDSVHGRRVSIDVARMRSARTHAGPRTGICGRKSVSSAGHERIVERSVTVELATLGRHVSRCSSVDEDSHASYAAVCAGDDENLRTRCAATAQRPTQSTGVVGHHSVKQVFLGTRYLKGCGRERSVIQIFVAVQHGRRSGSPSGSVPGDVLDIVVKANRSIISFDDERSILLPFDNHALMQGGSSLAAAAREGRDPIAQEPCPKFSKF